MKPTHPSTDTLLKQALLGYSARIAEAHQPPPSSLVFLRAELLNRRRAIDRATRPLVLMQTAGTITVVFATIWLVIHSGSLTRQPGLSPILLALAVLATLLTAAGSWTLLAAHRRLS